MERQERNRLRAFLSPRGASEGAMSSLATTPPLQQKQGQQRSSPGTPMAPYKVTSDVPAAAGGVLPAVSTGGSWVSAPARRPQSRKAEAFALTHQGEARGSTRAVDQGISSQADTSAADDEPAVPLLRGDSSAFPPASEPASQLPAGSSFRGLTPLPLGTVRTRAGAAEFPGSTPGSTPGNRSKEDESHPFAAGPAMPHQRTILGLVFLDLFAVGLAMPLVVPLIRDLGANPVELGFMSSIYGIVQLISGPYMGLVSDRRGRRLVILLSSVGTCVGYFLLGQSTNLTILALSRVITGLLKHSINATKSYIADHTSGTNRAIELGRMATASGLGIMVGPTVGGILQKSGGYWVPTTLASFIYIINCWIVLTHLPPNELPPAVQKEESSAPPDPLASSKQFLPRVTMLARPRVAALFGVRAILGLAIQVFRQGFTARLIYSFKLSVQSNGLLLSYQGALTSLVQGFAIKPLVQRYHDEPLILRGMLLLAASFVLCSISPSVLLVAFTLTPVALATGVLRTTYTALLTASVPPAEVGQLLGLSDAVMSGCRVMGPTLAGVVAQVFGHMSPGLLSGVLTLLATAVFQVFVHRHSMELLKDHVHVQSWKSTAKPDPETSRLLVDR